MKSFTTLIFIITVAYYSAYSQDKINDIRIEEPSLVDGKVTELVRGNWPETNNNTNRFQVSDAGVLNCIITKIQDIGLVISPFQIKVPENRRNEKGEPKLTGGAELFYQITPSLRFSITINTKFAETIMDGRHINLTCFKFYFPEKHDLFLDGASNFQFGIEGDNANQVSRKLMPFFSGRLRLDKDDFPIPDYFGTKFTGQLKNLMQGSTLKLKLNYNIRFKQNETKLIFIRS